ncbi:hypothetical protein [Pseudohongiella nitratireducens]|uniref:hypothetical protein n=1 Tax=Pseudohongiella nitratireducens TaxID=1768907 RepID=UPI0030EF1937|tara:strand:- start:253 stop:762 length:510 start_codon:yes stop_codon:yes gene_type:complete
MISAHLQKAIETLKIHDVYVRDQVATCMNGFNPKYAPDIETLTVQHMHLVQQSSVVEVDETNCLLQVFIRLGVRWVDSTEENEDLSVKAMIEGEFITEYAMNEKLDQQIIDEFALKNASYHVWPYWRELLSNHCTRMHLPRLILPTVQFAQNQQQLEKTDSDSNVGENP